MRIRSIFTRVLAPLAGVGLAVGLTTLPAGAVPSGYTVAGTDVSHHSGTIDWSSLASKGIRFGWAKATEGTGFIDDSFSANYSGAKSHGVAIGGYAFGRPDNGPNTGAAQADYLIDHVQYTHDGKTLPPQLDIEWPYWTTSAPMYPCYGDLRQPDGDLDTRLRERSESPDGAERGHLHEQELVE